MIAIGGMLMRQFAQSVVGVGFAWSCIASSSVAAQSREPDRCAKAAKVISKGHPAERDNWAFLELSVCGVVGANAFAAGIAHYRTETNIDALDRFFWFGPDNWRDATILTVVTRLANDRTATPQARVFAVRHLIGLLQPRIVFSYADLTQGADTTITADGTTYYSFGCAAQMVSHGGGSLAGAPLPPDAEARIRATLHALAEDPAVPKPVRNAAQCPLPPR
jgi:hypothetical protein